MYLDFPSDENSAPGFAILREDAQKQGKRYSFEDVLLIAEVVSVSSARKDYKDYDDCTAKYGRCITARTHTYGTGELPIELADGRTFTLDLDELSRPEPESRWRLQIAACTDPARGLNGFASLIAHALRRVRTSAR
ncbi:hypothetical protein [Streptomyces beihaiensis]|uniref:Uncharacterized protein n=1 Tax=Streptomyces beihaiensis TaxID=2984495 RepID=A0ABT3U6F6_9ACTN|nr:hypothetical protein [Streptomyces beihaiensis]MCX3063778.1 hypothetical protein [Streptomyces beihaiensis]